MKKILITIMVIGLSLGLMVACVDNSTPQGIVVVSRDESSGTRGAFEELIGFNASSGDNLPAGSTTISSGGAVMTQVAGNKNAIGYVSVGSLNDTIKALSVDGIGATSDNVLNGTYPLFRPFMVGSKKSANQLSALEKDFYDFMVSSEAQTIISGSYISIIAGSAYVPQYASSGKGTDSAITISGSTSVQPLMNSLVGRYLELNAGLTNSDIIVSGGGSSAGMTNAINETSVFGMASRELKSSEEDALSIELTLCKDGIAVIVHKDNTLNNVTVEELNKIYTGQITLYSELSNLA